VESKLKLLFTGFEPFGGETENPSWEVARLLHAMLGESDIQVAMGANS
jgi:pyrrolidone-carboxylate peptidase